MSEYVYYSEGGAYWIVPVGSVSTIMRLDLSTGKYVSRSYLVTGVNEHGNVIKVPDPDNPAEEES